MDDDYAETQWTPEARTSYGQRLEQLHTALDAHAALVLDRTGRDSEMKAYFASADRVKRAAAAFDDAEFDFCGSFPLQIEVDEDEFEDEEADDDGERWEPAAVIVAVGRWDLNVHDPDAFIAAGREARREAYPDETDQERGEAVERPEQAAYEIAHARGWDALVNAPGVFRFVDSMTFIPQPDYQGMGADPFAIARFGD
jgi:hypothetical protein